jgi:hypothetical protein
MCECTPQTMKTWERTLLACFFSVAKPARKMRALPGDFRRSSTCRLDDAQKR